VFKIERALTALQKVLKLRSQGRLPYDMNEIVSPTFDLNPWTLQAISPSVFDIAPSTVATAVGQAVNFIQPTDWLVVCPQSFGIAGGLNDVCLTQVLWQPSSGFGQVVVADTRRWGAAATATALAAAEFWVSTPTYHFTWFFSPAGANWQTRVNVVSIAVAPTFQGRVIAYDLARE